MATTITILTPENVEVTYELAGVATRILAGVLDALLQSLAITAMVVLLIALRAGIGPALDNWLVAAGVLLTFVIAIGYFLFFEARWNGQTPGKKALGTRVMKDAGFPIDFRAAAVRNLVRLADLLPGIPAVGIASIFFSTEYKRLGDYAAGTVVIRERPRSIPSFDRAAVPAVSATVTAGGSALPRPDELYAIRHFLDRRPMLAPEARAAYARRLALAFGRLLGYPLDQVAAGPEAFLQWLVDESVRVHGA
jgi:uncharacterized RDD family membrane protein YckC